MAKQIASTFGASLHRLQAHNNMFYGFYFCIARRNEVFIMKDRLVDVPV